MTTEAGGKHVEVQATIWIKMWQEDHETDQDVLNRIQTHSNWEDYELMPDPLGIKEVKNK